MRGIAEADSIALDPHKGLFLPYGTGCLLARDQGALRRAHAAAADYMPVLQDSGERVDFCDISPELSRDYRGLRVWLPLKLYGFGAFRAALDEKLDLAEWAAGQVAEIPGIGIVARPQLSVVAFRLTRRRAAPEDIDRLNRELLARVNARQRVYLTGTRLGGSFAVRVCVLSFRTHRDRVEQCLEDLRQAAGELNGAI
jgi:aromatic-L-amino-acid decarboxylase